MQTTPSLATDKPIASTAPKSYNTMYGVGSSKYLVNFHDGAKCHSDGSPFFDIRTFQNKRKLAGFIRGLKEQGYAQKDMAFAAAA